jgi:hypothetical protein
VAVSNEPSGLLGRLAVDVPDGHLDPQIGKLAVIKKIYIPILLPAPALGQAEEFHTSILNTLRANHKRKYAK